MRFHSWPPLAAVLGGVFLVGACAGNAPPPAAAPADLATLEAAAQQSPRDAALITQLGVAYYEAGRFDRAHDVLLSALALNPQNYPANIYLGLSYEELGKLDSARVAYGSASSQARTPQQRDEIQDRLTLLTRHELRQAARDAIAQEAGLSGQTPTANAVAVFPFRYLGSNEEYRPLARGMTQVMISDLAKLSELRLLEREQVQALVDELALTDQGRVDPATGARTGRMLRAARVMQGSLQEVPGKTDLRLDAAVVDASSANLVASGTGANQLQQLFAVQKQVLFRLVDQMGISLTPAERRALSERPTADILAFLAFSRGLESEDRGDFQAAEADFSAAIARDPNFRAAQDKRASTHRMSQAVALSPRVLAGLGTLSGTGGIGEEGGRPTEGTTTTVGTGAVLRSGVTNTVPTLGSTLTNRVGPGSTGSPISRTPGTRPPLPETIGSDNPSTPGGLLGTIIIIITRP